jgi:hypothetical protein
MDFRIYTKYDMVKLNNMKFGEDAEMIFPLINNPIKLQEVLDVPKYT